MYWNYFIVKLKANGEVDWGRYFMMDNAVSYGHPVNQAIAVAREKTRRVIVRPCAAFQ